MRAQKNYPEQLNLSDFSDKTLLILDDDDPFRGRLARAMEKKGFQVKEAKSVEEGLKIAQNTQPKLFKSKFLNFLTRMQLFKKAYKNILHDVMVELACSGGSVFAAQGPSESECCISTM